jgi:hypothetical protein
MTNNTAISWALAIEPSGAIWLGISGTTAPGVDELDGTGAIIFPTSTAPYTGGPTDLLNPVAVAIDHASNVWVANGGAYNEILPQGVAKFSNSGTLLLSTNSTNIPETISGAIG